MSKRILIVDDSRLARRMLKDAIPPQCAYEIDEACNGMEALEFCRTAKVDILFLDLTMPEMDGYQLLEKLQNENILPFVIIVSADIQPKARERVLYLGAKTFINKPINPEKIYSCFQEQGLL